MKKLELFNSIIKDLQKESEYYKRQKIKDNKILLIKIKAVAAIKEAIFIWEQLEAFKIKKALE